MTELIPIVGIVGATAVGKTATAIRLAQDLDGEVVSVDSRYFYRGMNIGTAKPSLIEQQGIPHHLIDIANPDEVVSLGIFQKMASDVIMDVHNRGKVPILVGGTGQYIRAVVEGWSVPEVAPQIKLRGYLQHVSDQQGKGKLIEWLQKLDPQSLELVDLQNPRRVIRALEVILTSGKAFSEQRKKHPSKFAMLQVGLSLPRAQLYQRADDRVERMMSNGFLNEVKTLIANGFDENLPSMTAIGYYELCAYLRGKMTLTEAIYKIKMRTHNFIRKQATWFRANDPNIHWVDMNQFSSDEVNHLARIHMQRESS